MSLNNRIEHYERNPIGRDLIVGDIHGQFRQLATHLVSIDFDTARDRLFSVGDLIDRGAESHLVLDWLGQPWFRSVRGNHEEALIAWACQVPPMSERDERGYITGLGAQWIAEHRDMAVRIAARFLELPLGIELETERGLVGILHADCPARSWDALRMALADDQPKSENERAWGTRASHAAAACVWSRSRAEGLQRGYDSGERVDGVHAVVCGHTPMRQVARSGNVHFIDTVGWLMENRQPWRHNFGELTVIDAATLQPAQSTRLWERA